MLWECQFQEFAQVTQVQWLLEQVAQAQVQWVLEQVAQARVQWVLEQALLLLQMLAAVRNQVRPLQMNFGRLALRKVRFIQLKLVSLVQKNSQQ